MTFAEGGGLVIDTRSLFRLRISVRRGLVKPADAAQAPREARGAWPLRLDVATELRGRRRPPGGSAHSRSVAGDWGHAGHRPASVARHVACGTYEASVSSKGALLIPMRDAIATTPILMARLPGRSPAGLAGCFFTERPMAGGLNGRTSRLRLLARVDSCGVCPQPRAAREIQCTLDRRP